jgi:hypothetical protein
VVLENSWPQGCEIFVSVVCSLNVSVTLLYMRPMHGRCGAVAVIVPVVAVTVAVCFFAALIDTNYSHFHQIQCRE